MDAFTEFFFTNIQYHNNKKKKHDNRTDINKHLNGRQKGRP